MKARDFAEKAHLGQFRKYTREPYVVHCINVAEAVAVYTGDQDVIDAAYLHDTLEDTDTTLEDIENNFNVEVADIVLSLTDTYTKDAYPNLNREERKLLEAHRLSKMCNNAMLIKYFDIMDNSSTIFKYDPKFARTYLKEKQFILSYSLAELEFGND